MAELVLDGLEVGAGLVGEGRGAVAEVVQPDRREFGEAAEPVEAVGDVVRVQRLPVDADEHVAGVLPLLPGGEAFKVLAAGVFAEDLDGVPVQGDDAAAGSALRPTDVDQASGAGDLLDDRGGASLEVDVAPTQAGLVNSDRRGTWVYHRARPGIMRQLAALLTVDPVAVAD